ncbi:NAD-dependent DNA ligase LigA [Aeromicrobium sp. 179-A 4D2 NHS]|uniref:NAD-dependent DNA ligase LigA n=1 Tax=Aeromicrobium sp. 179-A 4D2 NHS TaxID=3142375 RepID=UPI0039A2A11D
MNRTDFNAAADRLFEAADAYYNGTTELMTDAEYDNLLGQVEIALAENPGWSNQITDGLFGLVAAGTSKGGDVSHPERMLSLGKVKTLADVEKFIESAGGINSVVFEPKMDGLAVRVVYKNGRLVQMVTRGDGSTGEDITSDVNIVGMPKDVRWDRDFEVRGEVYMTTEDFEVAQSVRIADGEEPFKNSRNAVAGVLRKGDTRMPLSFAAYDAKNLGSTNHVGRMEHLFNMGFNTVHILARQQAMLMGVGGAEKTIALFGEARATVNYPTDGIVITANEDTDRDRLGIGSRVPRYAVAYKYEAESSTTVVRDIELTIGRTGRLALRAKVDPTEVSGTTITYASLHNVGWLTEQDIRIGDTVKVLRANDVIPRVESPDLTLRPADSQPWTAPEVCPQCGGEFDKTTELWRCTSPECSVQGRIEYAVSRDALDIEGMSTAIVTALVETELVTTVADLFDLTADQLADLALGETTTGGIRRLGATNAGKIMAEIDKAKGAALNRVITSLGIRMTGRTMSRRLATHFGSLSAFADATTIDLLDVEGVGVGRAETIRWEIEMLRPTIERLIALGMGTPAPDSDDNASAGGSALTGMSVVVTGKMTGPLDGKSRNEMNELIEANGGKASGSVSKNTSLLVCADPTSSKAKKADDLGVETITPDEFAARLGLV